MSWTSSGYFRNTNILSRLTADTGANPIEVYKPGTLSPQSIASGVRYSGFVTSLRLNADIRSISEFAYPFPEPTKARDRWPPPSATRKHPAPKNSLIC
ncbi:MAG: hypothetical protein HC895_13855 [Leptolyngbyaceae cyanobacterium SM1_3_5]|nr:hypothetical protein [Leptolyngbyaceae cyanobacterium SM1_3_5]